MEWKNYGDANPIEHGGIFIKPDGKDFPRCYYVMTLTPVYDSNADEAWIIGDLYVDLNNDWYEWDSVYSATDTDENSSDIDKVIALVYYYSSIEFGHDELIQGTRDDVIEFLADFNIHVE